MKKTQEKLPRTQKNYKDSLNLPDAKGFPMKAGLERKEPEIQKQWEEMKLFSAIREKSKDRESFVLHDGPPYANGSIHIGHLLNKILKDMVVRSKTMEGYDSFLIPGWDCHGLPIEHKVLKESEGITADADPVLIRKKCRNYAEKFVRKQTKEMKRLGTIADYENPYLTMEPTYEAGVLEVFAELVAKGFVRHDLKPVHWSIENRTALAEAELEYRERNDPSVYVLFPVKDAGQLPECLNIPPDKTVFLMIWTTTPWTLPANLAVAVSADAEYGLYDTGEKLCIVAEKLAGTVFEKTPDLKAEKLGSCAGKDLASAKTAYKHPFINRTGKIVAASYVGTDEGTGLVHTAPGHGAEDYTTGIKEGLDIYCPVLEDGTFDSSVPEWLCGKTVWEGNGIVTGKLRELKLLFHDEQITHSYPHDWRGKTPTIFRATEQCFVRIDYPAENKHGKTLRQTALESVDEQIRFLPEWGRKRLRGMLESRPDWCISRQRSWGLPIPAFKNKEGGILLTRKTVLSVAEKIRKRGSNFWFEATPAELLSGYLPQEDPDAPQWAKEGWENRSLPDGLKKGSDIFDVWFESGSSWHSVAGTGKMPDLYLEGSDQHRGWFQSSLLLSLGTGGKPPFKTLLTHGFIVDAQGRKMSKSGGNALEVETVLKHYGADVCRWWVSSLNCANDVKADIKIIENAADEYRTIRNTIRFLLGNLYDFNPETDCVPLTEEDDYSIDNIARLHLKNFVAESVKAYKHFNYNEASRSILSFCDLFLSKHYISAVRDRLYCDKADSPQRRKTQTVIYEIAETLIKLCAPVLVHTAEEAYNCLPGKDKEKSVHLTEFPEGAELSQEETAILDNFVYIIVLKGGGLPALEQAGFSGQARRPVLGGGCLAALEQAKKEDRHSNPLDAGIKVKPTSQETSKAFEHFNAREIADLIGISRIQTDKNGNVFEGLPIFRPNLPNMMGRIAFSIGQEGETEEGVYDLRKWPKCERCWKRFKTSSESERPEGGTLCDRCADAVGL